LEASLFSEAADKMELGMARSPHNAPEPSAAGLLDRRGFLIGAGIAGAALGGATGAALSQIATAPDHTLRIAPLRLELARGKIVDTFAYNGIVPGPALRLREGRQVTIDIRNDTDIDDIIHWHGLYVPAAADGAMEEGSPMVPPGQTRRYIFTPKPAGTRWYHSHDMAHADLTRSLYSGMYGFLIVEPASDPGNYDQEVLSAASSAPASKDVAVPFTAVKHTTRDNKVYLTMDTTKDALKSAQGFKYDRDRTTWVPDTSK
jgi:FtsP/CotA-like multicopper oxidase with cupredoxin domain